MKFSRVIVVAIFTLFFIACSNNPKEEEDKSNIDSTISEKEKELQDIKKSIFSEFSNASDLYGGIVFVNGSGTLEEGNSLVNWLGDIEELNDYLKSNNYNARAQSANYPLEDINDAMVLINELDDSFGVSGVYRSDDKQNINIYLKTGYDANKVKEKLEAQFEDITFITFQENVDEVNHTDEYNYYREFE